jgi:phosphopantetheine adenylyltransferase
MTSDEIIDAKVKTAKAMTSKASREQLIEIVHDLLDKLAVLHRLNNKIGEDLKDD